MKNLQNAFPQAVKFLLVFVLLCGVIYTGVITGFAQLVVPYKANGSIITVNGIKYGSEFLGQYYEDNGHMWGRIMNIETHTFKNKDGKKLMYAGPSNLSPTSEKYGKLVAQRVEKIRKANPKMQGIPVPVDLVTCSGSGLDPNISPAAAKYQIERIARARRKSPADIKNIIAKCTTGRWLGIFGEPHVNVLKVNLMLDGILKA